VQPGQPWLLIPAWVNAKSILTRLSMCKTRVSHLCSDKYTCVYVCACEWDCKCSQALTEWGAGTCYWGVGGSLGPPSTSFDPEHPSWGKQDITMMVQTTPNSAGAELQRRGSAGKAGTTSLLRLRTRTMTSLASACARGQGAVAGDLQSMCPGLFWL